MGCGCGGSSFRTKKTTDTDKAQARKLRKLKLQKLQKKAKTQLPVKKAKRRRVKPRLLKKK